MARRAAAIGDLIFSGHHGLGIVIRLEEGGDTDKHPAIVPPMLAAHFPGEGLIMISSDDCVIVSRANPTSLNLLSNKEKIK